MAIPSPSPLLGEDRPEDRLEETARTLAEIVEALAEDDPVPLTDHLAARGVDVERLWELPRWNAAGPPAPQRSGPPERERAAALAKAMAAVVERPTGGALLALHVWCLCSDAWEHTYRFERMLGTLEALTDAWRRARAATPDEDSRAAGDAAAALAQTLVLQIEAEAAMCRGNLARQAEAVAATARAAERVRELADRIEGDRLAPLREFLRARGTARAVYYRSLREATAAVTAAFEGDLGALAPGLEALANAERSPHLSAIERSELRAHRFSLERVAAAAEEEWLTVDQAEILYLFPFGLNGGPPVDVVAAARALTGAPVIAGITARAVRQSFEIDDIWAGSDYLDRRFDGAAVELPRVTLRHRDGEPLAELNAEIRVSMLGNHYLRLEGELEGADPQQVQAALFRAERGHGSVTVECGETEHRWDRLADFAADVQAGVAARLSDSEPLTARPGRYHVIVAVHEASAGPAPGTPGPPRRPVVSGDDLLELFGAQALLAPAPNAIGSLCGWSRYAVRKTRLLRDVRKSGDLVASTENTTVIALFGTPSFVVGGMRTMAEFVGSLDGLFSAWHDRLASHHPRVTHLIAESTDEANAEALARYSERLGEEQLLLHDFATETRAVLSLIHSPNLVTSPTDAASLVMLLNAAEVEREELQFATKLRELLSDRIEVRIDAMATKLQQRLEVERARQERFNRGIVDALLAAIAVFGTSGVVQILQAAGHSGPGFAAWAVSSIVVMALVCSLAVFRWSRSGGAGSE